MKDGENSKKEHKQALQLQELFAILTCCVQHVRPLNLKISSSGNLILLALPVKERDFWNYVASFHCVPHVF
jgi:hypothetical protein